jgi:hypothetical protein
MKKSYIETCVYPENAFDNQYTKLPGVDLYDAIEDYFGVSDDVFFILKSKLGKR